MAGRLLVSVMLVLAVSFTVVLPVTVPLAAAAEHCPAGSVALTFDDGPGSHTPAVLDALAARRVPATFFVVGRNASTRPDLLRRAAAEGHVIANHTYGHENLAQLGDAHIRATVVSTHQAVERAGVTPLRVVRPPYGATNARVRAVLNGAGFAQLLWTVDPQDWRGHAPATTASRVLGGLTAGAVVLLHDGVGATPNTIAALPRIIDEARARGFCFGVLDGAGRVVRPAPPAPPPPPPPRRIAPPQAVNVIAGPDRSATGVAVSRATWPGLVPGAVIADGDAWPDAITGTVLAAAVGGPLLLTPTNRLDAAVADELRRIAPEFVYLLGPVAQSVEDALWGMNIEVRRLRGRDRYATSELIAAAAVAHGADPSIVFVTTGRDFADGLVASGLAAGLRHPILLTRTDRTRPDRDRVRLHAARAQLGAGATWVVGGSTAVPDATVAGLPGLRRISGRNRTATAAAIADVSRPLGFANQPIVVSGWRFPDGLTGGGFAARHRRPVLLTTTGTLSRDVHVWLTRNGSSAVTVIGGAAAVGPGALCQLRTGYERPYGC